MSARLTLALLLVACGSEPPTGVVSYDIVSDDDAELPVHVTLSGAPSGQAYELRVGVGERAECVADDSGRCEARLPDWPGGLTETVFVYEAGEVESSLRLPVERPLAFRYEHQDMVSNMGGCFLRATGPRLTLVQCQGTTARVAEQSVTPPSGDAVLEVREAFLSPELRIDAILNEPQVTLPFEVQVTVAGSDATWTGAPIAPSELARDGLLRALTEEAIAGLRPAPSARGVLAARWDPPLVRTDPPRPRELRAFGDPATLGAVGRVVRFEVQGRPLPHCGRYVSDQGEELIVGREARDIVAFVQEAGAPAAEEARRFRGDTPRCPTDVQANLQAGRTILGFASWDEAWAWAEGLAGEASSPEPREAPAPDAQVVARPAGRAASRRAETPLPTQPPASSPPSGERPSSIVQRVVARSAGAIRACYERGLAQRPGLAGRVTVGFEIQRNGAVSGAHVESSTLGHPGVERCVVGVVARLRFPGGNDTQRVRYPFELRP